MYCSVPICADSIKRYTMVVRMKKNRRKKIRNKNVAVVKTATTYYMIAKIYYKKY